MTILRSPRVKGILLGTGLFLIGIIVGVEADRWLLVHRRPLPVGYAPGRFRQERWLHRFTRELRLTDEQQQAIRRILDASRDTIRQVQRHVHRKMRHIAGDTRKRLEAVLTPEQRDKYLEIRKRMRHWQDRRFRGRSRP